MESVAYIRVSTEEQVHGTSLSMQERACLDFARANGYKLKKENIFRDEGESAKATNRPQLLAMMEFCRLNKGRIDKCIVWKLDRFARNSDDHVMLRMLLRKCGVTLVSVTEPIDDSPTGKLMETVLSGFAQFDNEIRTHRTTSGMKKRLEQGGWPHDAPIGYVKARSANGVTTIAPDPKMAPILKVFLESFSTEQYTVKAAAQLAYEMGIRNKKGERRTWQTVKNTLQNPIYAGYIESKYTEGKRYTGLHQALISAEIFEKNQRIIAGNGKLQTRSDESDYPLRRNFLKCAYCNKFVTASAPRGNGGRYPRYSCLTCRSSVLGKPVSKSSDEIHKEFKEILSHIRFKDGRTKLFKQVVLQRWCDDYEDALKTTHELNQEIEKLRTERAVTIRKFTRDELSYLDKEDAIKSIDDEIGVLEGKKIEADIHADQREKIIDNALLFLSNPSEFWNRAPIRIQKLVQRTIFPQGLTYDFEKGFGTIVLSQSYLLINKIAPKGDLDNFVVAPTGLEPVIILLTQSLKRPVICMQMTSVRPSIAFVDCCQQSTPRGHWFKAQITNTKIKPPLCSEGFILVAPTGLEPVTLGL